MDDLISRAAAIEQIKRMPYWFTPDGYCALTYDDIKAAINNVPAVDAVPVVHARWVDKDFLYKNANANPRVTAVCSVCGNAAHCTEHGYSIFSKFCPNCGARMDGEAHDQR